MKNLVILFITLCLCGCAWFNASDNSKAENQTDLATKTVGLDDKSLASLLTTTLNKQYSDSNIEANVINKKVLLTGQVAKLEDRYAIEKTVKNLPQINQVFNYLQVTLVETEEELAQDSLITRLANEKLTSLNLINSKDLLLTTTKGIVYVLSNLTIEQKDIISSNLHQINGVKDVVILNGN